MDEVKGYLEYDGDIYKIQSVEQLQEFMDSLEDDTDEFDDFCNEDDYYNEWYNLIDNNDDDSDNKPILPEDVPDNQLMLFSIADDILENHVVVKLERSETVV